MAQRGALERVRRFDLSKETGGVRGAATGYLNVSAYQDVMVGADQADLPDNGALDSNKDPRRSKPGPKTSQLNFKFKLTEDTNDQYGALFEAALGSVVADSTLVFNGAGTQSATIGAYSSGTPDPWVKVSYTTGAPDWIPVKSFSGTEITYAIQSRIAARTVASIKNANQCTGDCYQQKPDADLISLRAEADRASEPNALSYLLQGLVPFVLKLNLPLNERARFEVNMTGCDWDGPSFSTSNVGDMPDWDDEFNGWCCDVVIYDPTTPAAFANCGFVAVEGLNFAPTWIANERPTGRTTSGTNPGSAVNSWRQGVHFESDVVVTVDVLDAAWFTKRGAGTIIGIAFIIHNGAAGATPTKAVCIDLPACELNSLPKEASVNGVMGQQISVKPRKSATRTAAHQTKCTIAFFNS